MSLDSIRVKENEEHTICIFSRQLAVCTSLTRPDINFVEGQYQSNPSLDNWKAAKKVMRYLQGTTDYRLTYMHINQLEVIGYLESLPEDIYIYIYIYIGGDISQRSTIQTIVASSTIEAIKYYEAQHMQHG